MNILQNGSFENGWTDYNASIQVPTSWHVRWADADTPNPYSSDPWNKFVSPEIVHKLRDQLPPNERDLFILDGDTTLKTFKGHGAFTVELSQTLTLDPGMYAFTMRVFGDLVSLYADGRKYWAADPNSGLLRFVLNGHVYDDTHSITPGIWNLYSMEFAADGETSVGAQIMCPFALANSGVWLDALALQKVYQIDTSRGAPREQFKRTYHVLPREATWNQAREVFNRAGFQDGQTVG
jgi:hypothetical protein